MALYCPKCGAHSDVTDTRYTKTAVPPYIRRMRRCPRCDRRWSTVEMLASEVLTKRQRRRIGNGKFKLINKVRRDEYSAIADELHKLAEKVALGELRERTR